MFIPDIFTIREYSNVASLFFVTASFCGAWCCFDKMLIMKRKRWIHLVSTARSLPMKKHAGGGLSSNEAVVEAR